MFIQIDSKTFVRTEHIAAVTFGTSYTQIYIAGHPQPFRVAGHEKIQFLRNMMGVTVSGSLSIEPDAPTGGKRGVDPEAKINTEKKRGKK